MPGYDKAYKGYPYNVEGAKKLLADAGLKDGFSTELWGHEHRSEPAHRAGDPAGSRGDRHQGRDQGPGAAPGHRGRRQQGPVGAHLVGRHGLDRRLPDPSDFYGPILGCGGAVTGGWNWSWYCDKTFEERATKADSMSDPKQKDERAKVWAQIFTDIQTQAAPWVPVFNERRVVAKSKRMGGPDQIYIDPTRVIDYEAIYAKQ